MRIVLSIAVSLLILGAGAGALFLFGSPPEAKTRDITIDETSGPLVQTVVARDWTTPFDVAINGEAVTPRVVTVAAEVSGNIVTKPAAVRGGRFVHAGDILFEIDPSMYQLRIEETTAQKLQVQEEIRALEVQRRNTEALLALSREDLDVQKRHLERVRDLFQKRSASEVELDEAIRRELTVRNTLQMHQNELDANTQQKRTAQAGLALADAAVRRAELDLKRCTVTAPISGRVVDDAVEQGNYVQPGTILVHIADVQTMEVKCSLRSDELAWIWRQGEFEETSGDTKDPLPVPQVACRVLWEFDGVETAWEASLSRLEGTGMDKQTRTFPCRVLVPEPRSGQVTGSPGGRPGIAAPALVSGMYVTVKVPIRSPEHLVQIPTEAIRPGGQVWVVRDDSIRIVDADVARVEDTYSLIRANASGIRAGEQVVISPLASVTDGMTVRPLGEGTR
ncbi:MAG: efflux RND transporter periplasmic adaptor subunit [Planctomycetaceae bacterium]|nr:efflux RND transporter periplasmic adaptor subunit [Planctomycetaceae bacterium]